MAHNPQHKYNGDKGDSYPNHLINPAFVGNRVESSKNPYRNSLFFDESARKKVFNEKNDQQINFGNFQNNIGRFDSMKPDKIDFYEQTSSKVPMEKIFQKKHICRADPMKCLSRLFIEYERKINGDSFKEHTTTKEKEENIKEDQPRPRHYVKGDKRFHCKEPNCNKGFTSHFGLRYHMNNGHKKFDDAEKPYMCRKKGCRKRYKNSNGLKYHEKTAH